MSPKLYSKIPHTVTVGCCVGKWDGRAVDLDFVNNQIKNCTKMLVAGGVRPERCTTPQSCGGGDDMIGGGYQRGGGRKEILAHILTTATIVVVGGGSIYGGWMALSWLMNYFFPLCTTGILDQVGNVLVGMGLGRVGIGGQPNKCVFNQQVWTAVISAIVAFISGLTIWETAKGKGPIYRSKQLYNMLYDWFLRLLNGESAPIESIGQGDGGPPGGPGGAGGGGGSDGGGGPPMSDADAAQVLAGLNVAVVHNQPSGGRRRRKRRKRTHRRHKRRRTRRKRRHTRRKHRRRRRKHTKRRRRRR